jgi:hypothetical protein
MDGASIENTFNRIDAAIARIERAAAKPASADSTTADSAPADHDLQARHQQLRSEVAQSLRQLDALLAGQEP